RDGARASAGSVAATVCRRRSMKLSSSTNSSSRVTPANSSDSSVAKAIQRQTSACRRLRRRTGGLLFAEAVANAAHGGDQRHAERAQAVLPQLVDVHAQRVAVRRLALPYPVAQDLSRHEARARLHQ